MYRTRRRHRLCPTPGGDGSSISTRARCPSSQIQWTGPVPRLVGWRRWLRTLRPIRGFPGLWQCSGAGWCVRRGAHGERDTGRPINRTRATMGTVPGVLAIFRALALQAWATVRPQDCASTAVIHSGTHRVEPSSPINALYVARVLRTPGSHFEASTPLTSSHSARDSSAMKIGIRNAMFARSGATSSRKLLTT